jgi:hypothetical protein
MSNKMSELYKNYLSDLIFLLKEEALKNKKLFEDKKLKTELNYDDPDLTYLSGKNFTYYEVLSLIQQQAEAFGIDPKEINLENFDADKDLLGMK